MRHDDVWHKRRELLDRGFFVFIDIYDQMRWRQRADFFDVHGFGATNLGHRPDAVFGMDAETGPANQPIAGPKSKQQFTDTGYQADDARVGTRHCMRPANGINQMGTGAVHSVGTIGGVYLACLVFFFCARTWVSRLPAPQKAG